MPGAGERNYQMAIVLIFSGSFCHGDEIADAVAQRLGYDRIDAEVIRKASRDRGVPEPKLVKAMSGPPPFFNRLTHEREKNLAYVKAALADLIQQDDVVYHGFASHFVPQAVTHALRVCLIANLDYRLAAAATQQNLPPGKAAKAIARDDAERQRWTQLLLGREAYADNLYDILLPMHDTTVAEAVATICTNTQQPNLTVTGASGQATTDFLLAARVNVALADKGHDVEVTADAGRISIGVNKHVVREGHYYRKLEAVAMEIAGVENVTCGPGTWYVPPGLLPEPDFETPSRILLVDDEREYVHTLSERLQTRNLPAEVVYDGEQALAVLASESPEVMVLDLKMPGIDGIEVLRRVKRDHPEVEVIILTGHGSDREKELAMELGAFAYLQKPVDIDVLAETMKKAYRQVGGAGPDNGEPIGR
jgi:CheY-like chemotaxis protein/cytidylate kinase